MEVKRFTFKGREPWILPANWEPFQVDENPEFGTVWVYARRPAG